MMWTPYLFRFHRYPTRKERNTLALRDSSSQSPGRLTASTLQIVRSLIVIILLFLLSHFVSEHHDYHFFHRRLHEGSNGVIDLALCTGLASKRDKDLFQRCLKISKLIYSRKCQIGFAAVAQELLDSTLSARHTLIRARSVIFIH
jgi:hypothetical protein